MCWELPSGANSDPLSRGAHVRSFQASTLNSAAATFRRRSDEAFLDRAPQKREGGVGGGHRGDHRPPPDGPRPPRVMPRAVCHSQCWHAASHLPRGVYGQCTFAPDQLQVQVPDLDSRSDERLVAATVKVRQHHQQPLLRKGTERGICRQQPLEAICPRNPTWPETPYSL